MRNRCTNPNNSLWKWYGGKGITVCSSWQYSYFKFKVWALSSGYSQGLTLDRVDGCIGYKPSNCRWASRRTQAENRTVVRKFSFQGKTQSLGAWARDLKIHKATLWHRVHTLGWNIEKAINTPTKGN